MSPDWIGGVWDGSELLQPKTDLLEVVATAHAVGRFFGRLNRGQSQTDHQLDDGDYRRQLRQR